MLTELKKPKISTNEHTQTAVPKEESGYFEITHRNQPIPERSLCGTCKYRKECVLNGKKDKILECEEFVLSVEPRKKCNQPGTDELNSTENSYPREDEFIGLCRTCSHRFDCIYLEGSSGVWNCEMYE